MLEGKKIILGVTGGIAAYKTVILARLLVKAGAEVQVIMTPNAKEFITPLTMSTITSKPVISEFFTANTGEWHSHVDLGVWADAMVIAPATASTIAKLANGVADNMLVTTYLSSKSPVFIAPAMDLDMMRHPTTIHNLEMLKSYGNHIIEPTSGELASHLVGKGRMEEPENIFNVLSDFFETTSQLEGKKVLITAGPTVESIDPVRFISNHSSGKMGYAIAEECALRGAEVTLVSGPVSLSMTNSNVNLVKVNTACEMYAKVMGHTDESDLVVLCAAVADYRAEQISERKIKRDATDTLTIKLVENPDIAKAVGEKKHSGQVVVGFALETDNEEEHAREKLAKKNLDMIVLNSLNDKGAGFKTDTNKVTILERGGAVHNYECKSKRLVAKDIIDVVVNNHFAK